MNKMGKKVRQMLTMLLASSILAGSVPVNAFGAANMESVMETGMVSEAVEETTEVSLPLAENADDTLMTDGISVSENDSEKYPEEVSGHEEDDENRKDASGMEEETEAAKGENQGEENFDKTGKSETEGEYQTENVQEEVDFSETVSGNLTDYSDEVILQEEEEAEKIDIDFVVSDDEYSSYIKVIHIDENNLETELEDYMVTTVAGEALRFRLEVAEGYKVTAVTMGNSSIPVVEGIYTIYPIASDTIEIAVAELEKYNVTFSYDADQVKNLEVKMGKKDVVLQDNVAVDMLEDSIVSFTVTLKKWMKVVKVTVETEDGERTELKAKEGSTYELEALKENVKVEIETSLDEKKCNTLDIVVIGHRNYVSVSNAGVMYGHNDRLLSKNDSETISVYLDNHYVMKQVLLNNQKVNFSGTTMSYTIDFSENKNQTIIFYVSPKKSNEEKKIVFANKASNITYEVNLYAPDDSGKVIVKKDEGKNHTYTVSANETVMEFTVKAKAGYQPELTIPEEVLRDVTVDKNVYVYSLAVATLGNEQSPTEIIIDEVPKIRTVSVTYDANRLAKMAAIVDGKYIAGKEDYDGDKKRNVQTFRFAHGTEIILQLEAAEGFTVGGIKEVAKEETLSEVKPQKEKYSYTIKANKDKTVELQLDGIYITRIFDCQGENSVEIEAEKKVYSVESGGKYKVRLYNGKEAQDLTSAVLKSGSKTFKNNVKIVNSEDLYLEIPGSEAGKTLTLELSCKDGKDIYTHTMKLKVLEQIKITQITDVKKGKVTQTADTVKEYTFTSNTAIAEDKLGVEIVTGKKEEDIITEEEREELNEKAREDFGAEIKEDTLTISVKTSTAGEKAYVKIYDVSRSTEEKKHYIAGGTVLVTSKAPAFVKTKPRVTLKNATNLELILSLSMKKPEEIENGELWYKVEGVPKYTDKTSEDVKEVTSSFVQYFKYTGASQVESVRVVGREDETMPEGALREKATFDIKVSLIQTTDQNEPAEGEEGNVAFTSKTAVKKNMSTKVPSYETKLGIKTIKTKVYTGQNGVVVAEPVFSKNASYQNLTCISKEEGIHAFTDEDNRICVTIDKEVEPGKYTIEIIAAAAEDMVPVKKEFTIQVVQGIYEISLDTPQELYKAYKENAVLEVGITYNEGSKVQPETQKVKWILQDAEGNDIDKEHPNYKIFTIKNGVITISKDFIVSSKTEENKFRVKAVANDYKRAEEEEVTAYSDWIVITNKKATLGELVLVKESEIGSGVYEVTARSGQKAAINSVNGSKPVVLKKGTPEREQYTESDFMEGIEEKLVYTCDNPVLKLKKDGTIKAKNIGNKISITAEMKDGSKVSSQLQDFDVVYAKAEDLGIIVREVRTGMTITESYVTGTTKFYGALDEILYVKVQEKVEGNNSAEIYGADYKLTVQGAKIVESNTLTGEYKLVAGDDVVVIEVLNNTKKHKKTFTLKNLSFSNEEVEKSKALQLTTKGTLKTGYFAEEQKIVYSLPKESIGKYTHAWITVDHQDYLGEKKTSKYDQLVAASGGTIGEVQQIGSNGKVVISFKPAKGEESYYIPETNFTYKLNISFGTVTDEYEFKAAVKSNAVSLKTTKDKLIAAKIQSSYNLSAKESGAAELALNSEKVTLSNVGRLMNENIKGVQNKFTEYFEVECMETEENGCKYILKLKPGVNVGKIGKNDLSGYISEYTYTDGNKEKTVYNASVKVVLKDVVQKYSLSKTTVLSDDIIDTNVNLMAGKSVVSAGYAYVPQSQKFQAAVNGDGSINLQSKDGAKLKASNRCTVYVIPENSYYMDIIEEFWNNADGSEENEEQLLKAMKKYGIKLTAVVNVKDKESAVGKIKFTANNLRPKFTANRFVPVDDTSTEGAYILEVPFTKVVDLEVEDITNQSEESLVIIEKNQDENSVILSLEKEALREAYAKDKKIYGKTITVKAVASFGEDAKDEIFTFKVTLPKQPLQLKEAVEKLKKVAWSDIKFETKELDEDQLVDENLPLIEKKVNGILSKDGDLQALIDGEAVAPTEETEGKIIYNIVIMDNVTEEQKKVKVEVVLNKILTAPMELEEILQEAILEWEDRTLTNLTTMSEILSSVRAKVGIGAYKHLRLYAKEVYCMQATANNAGYISGVFCIVNVANGDMEALELGFNFEIPKLMTFEEAAAAVETTVEQMIVYNEELGNKDKNASKTALILEKAEEVLKGQNYFVQLKQGATLKGEIAEGDVPGKATLQLEIVYLTTERLFKDILCEFQVLEEKQQ